MPEGVKKTKCGGGCEKNLAGGGYAGEGKEDEMRGGCYGKKLREGCQKTKCGCGGVLR